MPEKFEELRELVASLEQAYLDWQASKAAVVSYLEAIRVKSEAISREVNPPPETPPQP